MLKIHTILFFLLISISLSKYNLRITESTSTINETGALKDYYGRQFTTNSNEEKFYKAILYMYKEGIFKKGTVSIDMVDKGFYTQQELDNNSKNPMILLNAMGAARDAFCFDYPDIYYINWEKLSIRILSEKKEGKTVTSCKLGTGRSEDYFADGFTSESDINTKNTIYEQKLTEVINTINQKSTLKEKLESAYLYVKDHLVYKLEIDDNVIDKKTLRSVYGGLINGQGLCETYSRLLKTLLDKLNIPCILVVGKYYATPDSEYEYHMWNNVYLDGNWYGIDATFDDRETSSSKTYYLVTKEIMYTHIGDNAISESNYQFIIPELATGTVESSNFVVEQIVQDYNGKSTKFFKISYKGKGILKTIESYNVHLLANFYSDTENEFNGWIFLEKSFPITYQLDYDTYFLLPLETLGYAQVKFATTTHPYNNDATIAGAYDYDEKDITDITVPINNTNVRTSIPPPFAKEMIPSSQTLLQSGKTYDVSVIYDEDLESTGNLTITISDNSGVYLYDVSYSDLTFISPRTIKFKFTTSKVYASNLCTYTVSFGGLQGVNSKKTPYSVGFYVVNESNLGCPLKYGQTYSAYGKIQLLENSDLSTKDWTLEGKTKPIGEDLKVGIALVVNVPSKTDQNNIDTQIQNKESSNLLTSATYDISLSVCNCKLKSLTSGVRLKVMLPFPDGYGPNDAGVSFKAYHYSKDTQKIEEVDCMINEYGIIVFVSSFSPFTIAVVKDNNINKDKKIMIMSSEGGTVDNNYIILKENESKIINFTPNNGYIIDYVTINGNIININNNQLTISYSDLDELNNIIEVFYVASKIKNNEQDSTPIIPTADELIVNISQLNNTIISDIKGEISKISYQWYVNNTIKNNANENYYNLSDGEIGKYELVVTNSLLRSSKKSTSNSIKIGNYVDNDSNKNDNSGYKSSFNYFVLLLLLLFFF